MIMERERGMNDRDQLYHMGYQLDEREGFVRVIWCRAVNAHSFIQHNYPSYDRKEDFLEKPIRATLDLWEQVCRQTHIHMVIPALFELVALSDIGVRFADNDDFRG